MTDERVSAELRVAAKRAGLIDFDWLKLVDVSKVTLEGDGSVRGADEVVAELKAAKPHLFPVKMARDMIETEREAFWREARRGPKPEPMDLSQTKMARDMSETERKAFLDEVARRFE